MYVRPNFPNKKLFKEAVARGEKISFYDHAGRETVPATGTIYVEGPHFPQPHTWYAEVVLKDGNVQKVR